jgi:uncharacterized protein (DUF1501 family)
VPHLRGGTDNLFHYATYLGGGWNPFVVNSDPNEKDFTVRNLALHGDLTLERIADRRMLRGELDRLQRVAEKDMRDLDEHQQSALDLLTSRRVREAFDITRESEALRDSYGRHTFGQSALLARRLVESGVTFVTVNCVPWDHHGSPGQYKTEEGARLLIPPLDRAIAGLVSDLVERGLYDKTLVVVMGEFGRTPRINPRGGRDHYPRAFSAALAGCGVRGGQVIGKTDAGGDDVADGRMTEKDLFRSIYRALGINSDKEFMSPIGRPIKIVEGGAPVDQLFG